MVTLASDPLSLDGNMAFGTITHIHKNLVDFYQKQIFLFNCLFGSILGANDAMLNRFSGTGKKQGYSRNAWSSPGIYSCKYLGKDVVPRIELKILYI